MFILEMHARCFLQVAELRTTTPKNNFKMCALGFPECEERGCFFSNFHGIKESGSERTP